MTRKAPKAQKPNKDLAFPDMVNNETLTQEEKNKIKQVVSSRIKYLDEFLEEQLVSILFEDNKLKLPRRKHEDIILLAKQTYFQG